MPTVPLVALVYAGGIVAAATLGGWWWLTLLFAGVFAAGAWLAVRPQPSRLVLLATVALAGAGHAHFEVASAADPSPLASLSGTHDAIGVIRDDARIGGTTARSVIDVEQVDGQPVSGALAITLRVSTQQEAIRAGARLEVRGVLERPRTRATDAAMAFPQRWSVIERDAGPWHVDALRNIRRWTIANIERGLPEPAASLAAGVLIGEQRTMPAGLTEALRRTGTTHLVVVSGQNIALVTGVIVALLAGVISRQRAGVLALFVVPGYVVLVGGGAPVIRAAIMAAAIALAAVGGRRTPGWVFLIYAVVVMLGIDPLLARNVSFQLSASATAGVLLVAPPLRDLAMSVLRRPGLAGSLAAPVAEAATVTLGAAVAVLPVQAAAFGTASLMQIPANTLVAPLYGGTVFVAAATALLGWLPPVALVTQTAGAAVPNAFLWLVETLARVPGGTAELRAPLAAGVVWYAAAGAGVWMLSRRDVAGLQFSPPGIGTPVALAVVAGGLWIAALAPRETLPSITVLDVGQGLAVLVRDGGASVLVDTGPPDDAVIAALGRAGHRGDLDAVVISHADADHAGGLPAVERRVGVRLVLAGSEVQPGGLGVERLDIGDRIHVGRLTTIEVAGPPVVTSPRTVSGDNNRSLVLLVTVGERRVLLPADIEAPAEQWLAGSGLDVRADAVVVPHHGAKTSSTPGFLAAVEPRVAVISVGARNSYGHPAEEVIRRYDGVPLYRTDQHGDVTLRSDGSRLWVAPSRGAATVTR